MPKFAAGPRVRAAQRPTQDGKGLWQVGVQPQAPQRHLAVPDAGEALCSRTHCQQRDQAQHQGHASSGSSLQLRSEVTF
jgi:hypothetical protein